jgi:hypothetical protein
LRGVEKLTGDFNLRFEIHDNPFAVKREDGFVALICIGRGASRLALPPAILKSRFIPAM